MAAIDQALGHAFGMSYSHDGTRAKIAHLLSTNHFVCFLLCGDKVGYILALQSDRSRGAG
jgi:hypothetical protein